LYHEEHEGHEEKIQGSVVHTFRWHIKMLATIYLALYFQYSHHVLINCYALPFILFMSFMLNNQVLNGIKNYMMDIVLNQYPTR
jgi:hypothetical protein